MLISSLYNQAPRKLDVNARRINKERMRVKLQKASFISVPRLVKSK